MTKDEAITILKDMKVDPVPKAAVTQIKRNAAIEMAVEALKAQLTEKDTTSDCISRQEAIRIASGYCHPANVAKELAKLPSVQPEPHWIPVTERLPEPRTDVWVNSDIGQIQGYYEESVETWYASFGQGRDYLELIVNAWMPLPEPYEERRER